MDSQPHRQPSESVEQYLLRLNEETSLGVLPMQSQHVGWVSIIVAPFVHSAKAFFHQGGFRGGIGSFINAVLAGIYTLASKTKLWEYQMRKREDTGPLPPVTKHELERFTQL